MAPKAKVELSEAIDAVCLFAERLREGVIPAWGDQFYEDVSKALNGNWTKDNVFTNLRYDRRNVRSKVFQKLGIIKKTHAGEKNEFCNMTSKIEINNNDTVDDESSEGETLDDTFVTSSLLSKFANSAELFDLIIPNILWEQMKPVSRKYGNRYCKVLKPGGWTDPLADNFWKQYRMPCAFSFKKCQLSYDKSRPFLSISGKCTSKKCNNEFLAIARNEPRDGEDLLILVKCKDTRLDEHETVVRQLRNDKRKLIGQQILKKGAANCRRDICKKEINLGDVHPPILYSGDVMRKLGQECRDKELGIDPKDGTDPVANLLKLMDEPPYIGSIHFIASHQFMLQYLLPEQTFLYKEYCRLLGNNAQVCLDSTASLVTSVKSVANVQAPTIFLFEIVINIEGVTVSVGQMLSAALDTNTILFWINKWLVKVGIKPKTAVVDYSKALLGGLSYAFNNLQLKSYIQACFSVLTNPESAGHRPAPTFIRVDVAHFMNIFCRLKCFTEYNKPVKDFLIRCVALLVSCEEFGRFQEILTMTLIVSIHSYDGEMIGESSSPSPAEKARMKLLQYIGEENHDAMKLVPNEESAEFKDMSRKIDSTGLDLDPHNPNCYLHEEPDTDVGIKDWLNGLKSQAEQDKDKICSRVNAYRLPQFFKHLCRLASEFVLWSAVMTKHFKSTCIRATSCFVEGDFGELKNNVLRSVHGKLRPDKLFRYHFNALQGQAKLGVVAIKTIRMSKTGRRKEKNEHELQNPTEKRKKVQHSETEETYGDEFPSIHESQILAHSSSLGIGNDHSSPSIGSPTDFQNGNPSPRIYDSEINWDLDLKENWRNQGDEEDPLLTSDIKIGVDSEEPDSILKERENWRNKAKKDDFILHRSLKLASTREMGKSEKRKLDQGGVRKPSKYFKPCPDILIRAKQAASGMNEPKIMLLRNGSNFEKPIKVEDHHYIIKNTCPFDSIIQILAVGVNDCAEYFRHLESSGNSTCDFILNFIESGIKDYIYGYRCMILKDFVDPMKVPSRPRKQETGSYLTSKDVWSNILDMWKFLMPDEPSMERVRQCRCGSRRNEKVSYLQVNHKLLHQKGFRSLQEAVMDNLNPKQPCSRGDCDILTSADDINFNAHIMIESDIRELNDPLKSLTCKVKDFPVYLTLHQEKFRLTGIIIHNLRGHYMALCRRINGTWEIHNDCESKIRPFLARDYNRTLTPQAVLYIRISGK